MRVLVREFSGNQGDTVVQTALDKLMTDLRQKNFVVIDVDLKRAEDRYTCVIKYESLLNRPMNCPAPSRNFG